MCILCVIQKWSRRIATMLPWLVLPLIALWALSQMLPPAFRFEITSPRLACVFVLLVTLFWYEILMPKLSSWRAHRNARLRERKKNEAIELQKLRKAATRKCRNCLTAYRDQNPGGGKFMCSYCGHVSKRPVLDLPVPPGMGISNSSIIKDLVGKGGKLLNGRAWSENGWICSQDWLDNGNWGSGSFAQKHVNWRRNANGSYGGDDHCLEDKSYSGFVIFACKMLTSFVFGIRWLCRKIFSGGSSSVDDSFNAEHSRISSQNGECVGNIHESRTEKARRKAEEKRQARQEKELLEEEERKQREEVAKLVEERRKLRGEKLEAEKDSEKANSPVKRKDGKKEAEKKRQERRKERDRGSSKSNSDAEELEKRAGKEAEKKLEWDRKGQTNDNIGRGLKNLSSYNVNRGSSGARYLDRMRNNILSSSKALSGTNFFGRTANTPFVVSKPTNAVNHVHSSTPKKEVGPPERVAGKLPSNGVLSEPQPFPSPKKAWHQLFTRSTSVHPSSSNNVISRPNAMGPSEVNTLNNSQSFGLPSPYPPHNVTASSSRGFSPTIDPIFPHKVEEPELFEDPCYVPDPVSLLGPVSESLDNFQLNLGSGFLPDFGKEKPCVSKIVGPVSDISRPSPIESPLSKLRGGDKASNDKTWHLWGPSPLCQDGLGLIGGPTWHINPEWNRLSKDPQRTTTSLFTEDPALNSSTYSQPHNGLVNGGQDGGGSFSTLCGSTNQDPWLQKAFIPPLSDEEKDFTCWSKECLPSAASKWATAVEESGESSRNESAWQQEIGDVWCNSAV